MSYLVYPLPRPHADHLSWVPTGRYEEAVARLQPALQASPPSAAAQARRGLLQFKKGDVATAALDLQCLAETDAQDLSFLLCLLQPWEQQRLTQVGAQYLQSPLFKPLLIPQAPEPQAQHPGGSSPP